jgi:fructose-bisphosphate aldolase class I
MCRGLFRRPESDIRKEEKMDLQTLEKTARELVAEGKGILAADESFGTIEKRFNAVGIDSTEESRRDYRELTEQGVIPGIKVDKSTVDMPLSPGEKFTQGLDGLRERLSEYREMGARFTKWRAVITIGEGIPTHRCINANARALALYAAFCQEEDLVPIVEPETLIDGDHSIERCYEVTEATLRSTFDALYEHQVELSGILLKPNMVISGKDAPEQAGVEEVARATVECLLRSVPAAVPGIVFLSGGQSDKQATAHLNAMNRLYPDLPWELSFSYARALQDLPMKTWKGDPSNVEEAQKAFYHRAKMNGAARSGSYSEEMEEAA